MNDKNKIGLISLLKALLLLFVEILVGFFVVAISCAFAGIMVYFFNLFLNFIL